MNIMRTIAVLQLVLISLIAGEVEAKKHAVIVGVADYPNANSLRGPVEDANNMHSLLVETFGYQKDEIKLLTEGKATRRNILSTLQDWLVNDTQPGDDVLFYFSGHGFQVEDKNKDEDDNKDEAIAAYDVATDEHGGFVNMITDDEIGDIFKQINDREVTVIIDSCHSGTLTRGGLLNSADGQYDKTLKIAHLGGAASKTYNVSKEMVVAHRKEESFIGGDQKRAVWSAVSSWQKALVDFETHNGSVFTNLYIKGVRDKKADRNNDSVITRSELLDFIRDGSTAFCERNTKQCKTGLTPTLETTKDLFVEDILSEDVSVASVSNAQYIDQALVSGNELVTVTVLPGATVKAGQHMQVRVNSQVDGYLMIFDVRDSGELVQLFPNEMVSQKHQNGKITRNEDMFVPGKGYGFRYEAFDPGSSGRIYAIVSEDRLPDNVATQKDLVVENPKQYVNELATTLRQVWNEDLINRQIHWSAGSASYEVTN